MAVDDDLRALALVQRGCLTTAQAMSLGLNPDAVHHRVARGLLVRLAPRVLAIGGMPIDDEVLAVGAVLGAGGRAALSHTSAAAHWRLPGYRTRPLHVTRQRDGTFAEEDPVLGTVHTTRVLPDSQLVRWHGVHVTAPTRTLFDLAPRVHPRRLERLLDRALADRLVTVPLLRRTLAELAGRGRPGIRLMRELIGAREDGRRPPESGLESRFEQLLAQDGQPPMERQVDVGSDSWIGRVDFLDRSAMLVVEIDGDRFHGTVSDQRDDARRTAELQAAGWRVLRCTAFDVWHRPQHVQRTVRAARRLPPPRASLRSG